jgi:hypothetical protein
MMGRSSWLRRSSQLSCSAPHLQAPPTPLLNQLSPQLFLPCRCIAISYSISTFCRLICMNRHPLHATTLTLDFLHGKGISRVSRSTLSTQGIYQDSKTLYTSLVTVSTTLRSRGNPHVITAKGGHTVAQTPPWLRQRALP